MLLLFYTLRFFSDPTIKNNNKYSTLTQCGGGLITISNTKENITYSDSIMQKVFSFSSTGLGSFQ